MSQCHPNHWEIKCNVDSRYFTQKKRLWSKWPETALIHPTCAHVFTQFVAIKIGKAMKYEAKRSSMLPVMNSELGQVDTHFTQRLNYVPLLRQISVNKPDCKWEFFFFVSKHQSSTYHSVLILKSPWNLSSRHRLVFQSEIMMWSVLKRWPKPQILTVWSRPQTPFKHGFRIFRFLL